MSFSGQEVTEKGLAKGWDPERQDQASQREFRNVQLLEAAILRPWAWKPHDSNLLKYAYYGGLIDDTVQWVVVADGTVQLADDATNYIERTTAGIVQVNQTGFTYPDWIPMASIRTAGGEIISTSYVDSRPMLFGEPDGSGGAITFTDIMGFILDGQVPLSAVAQWQNFLCIRAAQVKPGTFGSYTACNPTGTGDYVFPRNLSILQDLLVGRDLDVTQDALVGRDLVVQEQSRRGLITVTGSMSPYTMLDTDWHVNADTSVLDVEVLLPDAALHNIGGHSNQIHVKNIGTGSRKLSLTPAVPGQLIDGHSCVIVRESMKCLTLVSDGSNWWIQ